MKANRPFTVLIANSSKKKQKLRAPEIVELALPTPIVNTVISTGQEPEIYGVDDIDLTYAPKHIRPKVREMLNNHAKKHAKMWDGHLGTMNVAEHRIKIKEGAQPCFMQLYRMGPLAREEERK